MTELPDAIARATRLLSNGAWFEMTLDRNERDSYVLDVRPLRPVSVDLARDDLVSLLPPGSRWWQALGWHSYFGLPFQRHQRRWLLIGAQAVLAHHSGGAYVVQKSYVFPEEQAEQVSANLLALAQDICTFAATFPPAVDLPYRIVIVDIGNPVQFTRVEANILFYAAAHYLRNRAFNFRTLILSEDEYIQLERQYGVSVGDKSKRLESDSLYSILCSILDTFSPSSQRAIRHSRMQRFPLHKCMPSDVEQMH